MDLHMLNELGIKSSRAVVPKRCGARYIQIVLSKNYEYAPNLKYQIMKLNT